MANWTSPDRQGNPGVSEEIAGYAIRKIQEKIVKISKAVSEETKVITLIEITRTIHRIKKDAESVDTQNPSYVFQNARFQTMEEGFWKYELKKFVGESEAKRIREKFAPEGK